MNYEEIISMKGAKIDLGCGGNKQKHFLGMDKRALPGVDIVHDLEVFPYPLQNECCVILVASHFVEHLKPWLMLDFMNECWRICEVGATFAIAVPYAGSRGYWQDPTHCLKDGAEVLTEEGFKDFKDVRKGENILTLNPDTQQVEYSETIKVIAEDYSGELLQFKTQQMNLEVTPNHDLVWWPIGKHNFYKSSAASFEDLNNWSRQGTSIISGWEGVECVSPEFMELLGWILSEGGFYRGTVSIYQVNEINPEKYNRIIQLMQKLNLDYAAYPKRIDIKNELIYSLFSSLGNQGERYIPVEYKNGTKKLLLSLLGSLLLGDGEAHVNGEGWTYTTISKQLAKDVNEIASKCGFRSSIRVRKGGPFESPSGKIYTRQDQYRISITNNKRLSFPKPKRVQYTGKVRCVTVKKNHIIYVRQNGHCLWVGNCNGCNEVTWQYFDPAYPLYGIYKPKPWRIQKGFPVYQNQGNLEVILEKLSEVEDGVDLAITAAEELNGG